MRSITNRLNVRLTFAFIGVVILVLIVPLLIALIVNALGFGDLNRQPDFVQNIPADELARIADSMTRLLVRQILIYVLLTAVIGIIAGIFVSRSLTAPLGKLARAARDIGQGDLSRRVTLEGSEEIVDVASAFNDMARDLEQAETLRRNLLADVAHELRTPLTVVQGNLRAILDDVYPLEKEEITHLYDQTRHLTNLITDLQELAQAEARRLPLNRVDVNAAALVKETAVAFQPIVEESDIELRVELLGAHPHVWADQNRLRQCLLNLMENALRHTPAGGSICVQVEAVNREAQIRVRDSGAGIAAEHITHVFDRFYRADPARSRESGGAGLGLAIVQAFVEAQDGRVSVASDGPKKGTLFVIHLPLLTQRQTS